MSYRRARKARFGWHREQQSRSRSIRGAPPGLAARSRRGSRTLWAMTTLSHPTLGLLADAAAEHAFTLSRLGAMLLRCDLTQYGQGRGIRYLDEIGLLTGTLLAARDEAEAGDPHAHRGLLAFVRVFVEKTVPNPAYAPRWFDELQENLLADGYLLRWDPGLLPNDAGRYEILPTDAGPVPLGAEISALERELDLRGYDDVLNHYRQATNVFGQHTFEAANSQLRTTLEALVVHLAEDHTGFVKPLNAGGGGQAVDRLKRTTNLAHNDGGDLLKALWDMSHTKGPHPGRSNADETRFRLHVITATARLLLHRFPPPQ
jgi:hypothetical protein